jgi:DNA repair protein RadC
MQKSQSRKKITAQLCEAGKLLGVRVIYHIIVTQNEHYSFQKEGSLNGFYEE